MATQENMQKITNEISILEFQSNSSLLDRFLVRMKNDRGLELFTYPKLEEFQRTAWPNYFSSLQDEFSFHLNPKDLVIDIGAHHGVISFNCAALGAEVWAYEPNPINLYILDKNKTLNPGYPIKIFPFAVSESESTQKFQFGLTSTTGSLASSNRDWKKIDTSIDVRCISLERIFSEIPKTRRIKLLKIDCEGGEYSILKNVQPYFSRVDFIAMEGHPTSEHDPKEIPATLEQLGFKTFSKDTVHGCMDIFAKNTKA